MLVADLESVGGPASIVDRLRDVIKTLGEALTDALARVPGDQAALLAGLRQAVESMDELLAASPWQGGPGSRREFWK
jgi:ElaB/YqjD/DUF883 family membrane-anchored ribosome-binding protein